MDKRDLKYGQEFIDKKTKELCKIVKIEKYIYYRVNKGKTQFCLWRDFCRRFTPAPKIKIFTLEFEGITLVYKTLTEAKRMKKLLGVEKYLEPKYRTVNQIKRIILNVQNNNIEEE